MDPSAAEVLSSAIRRWHPASTSASSVSNPRWAASKISERKKVWFLASTCSLRGLPPQYHRRCSVSQPSSRWIGVGPLRHGHQEHFPFHRVNPENCIGFSAGGHPLTPNPTSVNKLRCPPHNPPPVLRQVVMAMEMATSRNQWWSSPRSISTPPLHTLLRFHVEPING